MISAIFELEGLYICDPPPRPKAGQAISRGEITQWIAENHPGEGWVSDFDIFFTNWTAAFHYVMCWL